MFVNILLVTLIAVLTISMAALGGQLASNKGWHKWFFWVAGGVSVLLIVYQTYRAEKSTEQQETKRQKFEDRITEKLDEIIKHPATEAQKQAAIKLKREISGFLQF